MLPIWLCDVLSTINPVLSFEADFNNNSESSENAKDNGINFTTRNKPRVVLERTTTRPTVRAASNGKVKEKITPEKKQPKIVSKS